MIKLTKEYIYIYMNSFKIELYYIFYFIVLKLFIKNLIIYSNKI